MQGKKRMRSEDIDIVAQCDSEVEQYRSIVDNRLRQYFILYDFNKKNFRHKNNDDNTLEDLVDAAMKLQMAKNNILDRVRQMSSNVKKSRSFSIEFAQYYQKPKNNDPLLKSYDDDLDKIRYLKDDKLREAVANFDLLRVTYIATTNETRSSLADVDPAKFHTVKAALISALDAAKARATELGFYAKEKKASK